MRLISLTANQPSFKPVIFNRIGLTLIVGRHRSPKVSLQRADLSKTYNGVGKSLTVALINYCLGSNKNEQFDKLLPNWAFTLEFEHARISHRVTRTTGDAKIVFDDEPLSLRKFVEHLESLDIFKPPNEDVKSLTFRSLLTFFLRPKGASYLRYDHPQTKWTDYQSILCQSFLLGLDHHRADQKHKMKLRLDENVELADRYKKDKELKAFYVGEKNAEVELLELGVEIARLEADLHAFRVAEQYAERQQRADQLHHQLSELRNDVILQRNLISDLEMALAVKPDVSPEQVLRVFQEASVLVPELVVKRLEDVQVFHQRLQENRSSRLRQELAETQAQSLMLTARISQFQSELDAELQFLNAHRALDEYAANNAHLTALRGKEQRIKDYLKLSTQHTEEAQKVRAQMAKDTVTTSEYLHAARPQLELLMSKFREYARELYGPVPAGLTVTNNDGENQCRYNILAHIQNDAADGINQGKIFCYDMLLLTLRERHGMNFVFHDNRLFADMDKHQRFCLFRLADRLSRELGAQYIATVNEDVLDSVRDLAGDEFQRLFVDPVVLELTDAMDGSGKILGIQVDMKYDD